jgi:PAS domain S-box-containing protein
MSVHVLPDAAAFLRDGGELGSLIAAYEWEATPLGPIAGWPVGLKTTVGLALRSPVPIVMLFGDDGIMVYNDAYSVFAGGRHPRLLGSKVREGWDEVADFNDNVMRVVMAGGTLAYREMELTLHRNGAPEQVWMNLDYSPIPDERGRPMGVIAIVVEVSEQVRAERWLASERERMRQMFEQAPGFMAMLTGPEHRFDMVNAAYLTLVGHREVVGKPIREALPEIAGQGFFELLDGVYESGQPFVGSNLRVMVERTPGAAPEERVVDLVYQPVRDRDGKIVGIFAEGSDVTERYAAEQRVRESELQFRTFAEAVPNHVWTAPPDGKLDWFNNRVYEYSGFSAGELDGDAWAGIVHPDDLPAAGARWGEALQSGKPYEVEFRLRRHDGAWRWHIGRAVPIRDDTGCLIRWVGTNTDIHDQKRIAEELAESEARLQLAIDAGQLAVWELDVANRFVTPSPAMNRLYGFPDDAIPSAEDYASRYAPGEAERLARLSAEAAARGDTDIEVELRHLWPDGTEKWLLVRAQSIEEGRRAIGVVIDITERRRTEERLIESERRFRLSQEAAGIGSLELDIPTGRVMGTDRFWQIWGLEPRDSIEIAALEAIVVPEHSKVRSTEETRRAGTAQPSVEYRIRRPDTGELRWISRHIEFVNDESGRPVKMYGVVQDITDAKEAQARQELLTHELEHRIKNILAMVSAIASQTLRSSDVETARAALNDRLRALANAHDILTRTRWTQATLEEVVTSTLAAVAADSIRLHGPSVSLPPKMALSLALAVNELATNSLKYGALSAEGGSVDVGWSIAGSAAAGRTLTWTWRESGGPEVVAPTRRGFGRFLVERVLATDFSGKVTLDYAPAGLVCTLAAPLPDLPVAAAREGPGR